MHIYSFKRFIRHHKQELRKDAQNVALHSTCKAHACLPPEKKKTCPMAMNLQEIIGFFALVSILFNYNISNISDIISQNII